VKFARPENQQIQVAVKEQSSDGETLFSVADGRLNTATLNQTIVIEATGVGQVVAQRLVQKSNIAVRPADEATDAKTPSEGTTP
jgi:hypothetical protein